MTSDNACTSRLEPSDTNPRYILYARAHGNTSIVQQAIDRKTWPGGSMTGFILWMRAREREFKQLHPEACIGDAICDQDEWDCYLLRYVIDLLKAKRKK